jgi:hypothetical protein
MLIKPDDGISHEMCKLIGDRPFFDSLDDILPIDAFARVWQHDDGLVHLQHGEHVFRIERNISINKEQMGVRFTV